MAKLEERGLAPLPPADRRVLLRRVTYDLTGLPPTPEELRHFLADESPDAWSRVIDRLLDSPRYGERYARHWMDVVRYADTAGDNADFPIPQMHRYRDWIIDAFNGDLPYDEFIRQQLAGDQLPAQTPAAQHQQTIATGYIANARRFGSRVDDYPQHLTIEDTIDNLGRAFQGLSLNCARCHDHKFDPISTEDYYGLYGFFHSTRYPFPGIELEQKQRDFVPLVPSDEAAAAVAAFQTEQARLDAIVQTLEKSRDELQGESRDAKKKEVDAARKTAESHSKSPLPFDSAYAVADSRKIEDVPVQYKGDPAKPGPRVRRRFPVGLGGYEVPVDESHSGRLSLANWIASRNNPLTARVMVNRLWGYHFGRAIVPSPNDFGRQGKPASHPELLDWLACQFMDSGWSIKAMHRQILNSETYQRQSVADPSANTSDPSNELLSGFNRRRLDAESIRDALLFVAGNLDLSRPGPHPFPPQAEWSFTQHNPFKAVYESNHRSVYLMTQRTVRHPYLGIFDGADNNVAVGARGNSTTPLQALFLLNNSFVYQQTGALAARVIAGSPDLPSRVNAAYEILFARPPSLEELAAGINYLVSIAATTENGSYDQNRSDYWCSYLRVLTRLNEFVYID